MTEASAEIEIPKRALFRASEVCELAKVQPYVLRSWEAEFPALGVAKTAGGPRMYRRSDVEQVMRIKHLLLVDGLTLAGARRKLEEDAAATVTDAALDELIGQNVRDRIREVKLGLRAILDLLSARTPDDGFELQPQVRVVARVSPAAPPRRGDGARGNDRRASQRGRAKKSSSRERTPGRRKR